MLQTPGRGIRTFAGADARARSRAACMCNARAPSTRCACGTPLSGRWPRGPSHERALRARAVGAKLHPAQLH
eukprot:3056839-Alexandrium_andersonii.AAC.1